MKVLVLVTYDTLKSDEDLKKWREFDRQYWYDRNKKYNVKTSGWTDGTGKWYYLAEFESYEVFGKYMDDEGLQRYWQENCRLIHNIEMKVLREYI